MRRKKKERRGWRKKKREAAPPSSIPGFVAAPSLAYLLFYLIMEFSYVCHFTKLLFYHLPPL
jgi:hypothetical protein